MIYLSLILTTISLIMLLYSTYLEMGKVRVINKGVTSLLFVLIGILSYRVNPSLYGIYMMIALGFGALGDILLGISGERLFDKDKWFFSGMGAFSIAHILYIVAFAEQTNKFNMNLLYIPIIITIIFIVCISNKYFKFYGYKFYVIGYSFIISTMLIVAINLCMNAEEFSVRILMIILGSILFVISDIVICFKYFFYEERSWIGIVNLMFYYTAQICLAISIIY